MKPSETIIAVSFTGKISTGPFENSSPFFSLTETYSEQLTDEEVKGRQAALQKFCYDQFKAQEELARVERIQREYKNIRFYDVDNKKMPSVTSIINWDVDFSIPPDELAQYGARGTIIDRQVQVYLETGVWKKAEAIPEIYPELVILKNGNLGLMYDDVDFLEFYEEYPFKTIQCQKQHINHEHSYAGRSDIVCIIESKKKGKWDKIAGVLYDVPTILDVKSGAIDKTKHFKQQVAYARCETDIKQIGLIPLNNKTVQGFSKPLLEQDLNKHWSLFLRDRDNFRKRYGV